MKKTTTVERVLAIHLNFGKSRTDITETINECASTAPYVVKRLKKNCIKNKTKISSKKVLSECDMR